MEDRKPCESATVKFSVQAGGLKHQFVGKKSESVQDAMQHNRRIQQIIPTFAFFSYILFAEVEGHAGKVAILPSLLCGWLKDGSCIEIENSKKKAALKLTPKDSSRDPEDSRKETLLFIKIDDRKRKYLITSIPYAEYKFRELCVSVVEGDSFKESLEKDGRLVEVERFQITNEKNDTPDIDTKAKHYHCDVFSVSVKRNRKRKAPVGAANPVPPNCSNVEEGENGIQSDSNLQDEGRHQKIFIKEAPEEDDVTVPFSPPSFKDILPNDISKIVFKIAKSKICEMLLSPEEVKNKKKRDQAICDIVEKRFSKKFDARRPAWLLDELSCVAKSVGRIFFGKTTGTCFLLKKDTIITNLHVLCDIVNELKSSTVSNGEKKIRVRFNHIRRDQVHNLREVFVTKVVARSIDLQHDYVILRLNQSEILGDLEELGARVRSNVPDDGLLTIIGHPDGQEKVEETCRIVSTHLWRNEAVQRVQSGRPPAQGFDEYLFSCKEQVMSAQYSNGIAYDTSLFHGASGSPCINENGHIVAIHTSGFEVKEMEESVYIMEFGISFNAIYADLKRHYGANLADDLFPELNQLMDL